MALAFLLVLVLFLICLHIYIRHSEYGRTIDAIPGPPALPICGNLLLAVNISLEEAWALARRFYKQYYPILRVWKITSATVLTCDPDHVQTVLCCKKNLTKSMALKYMKFDKNGGIISSEGPLWRHRRRLISQAFTPELVDYYSKTAIKHAEKFVTGLLCQPENIVLNIAPEFLRLSMSISLEATMGLDFDKIEPEEENRFRDAFSEISEIVSYRVFRPYITDWMMKFLPVGRRQAKVINVINNLSEKIIQERIACHENLERNNLENDVGKPKRDGISEDIKDKEQCLFISDVLLQAEKKGLIDRRGIFDEAATILLSGFETSGTQMCFILALLAENKRAQDLLRAEILQTLGPGQDKITVDNVRNMDYLDRCIKESIRLLPAIPHIGRMITDTINLGEYKVLPGTEVYLGIFDLHRDPNHWTEPEKFDPDRFLPENSESRHKYAFIPFGAGARNCIGKKLAMMQMKVLTAYVIHNFILEPVDLIANQNFPLKITLTVDQYRLRFIRINR